MDLNLDNKFWPRSNCCSNPFQCADSSFNKLDRWAASQALLGTGRNLFHMLNRKCIMQLKTKCIKTLMSRVPDIRAGHFGARHLPKGQEMFASWHVHMPSLRHKDTASRPTTLQNTRKCYTTPPKAKKHSRNDLGVLGLHCDAGQSVPVPALAIQV